VEKAVWEMRDKKATRDDVIPENVLKLLGEDGFTNDTADQQHTATKCSDHRTLSIIAHAAKIVARILRRRVERKTEDALGEDQFGFRRGKGTRDAIGMLRMISERSLDIDEEKLTCFIDWQKACGHVNWTKLMLILKELLSTGTKED
jgi:hypothetical protein